MGVPLFHVDAFADRPFTGNPAAICLLPHARDRQWMQQVAGEMNLAETAFLHCEEDGHGLRWFTPTAEVDLCGHATLASAHVLWQEGLAPPGEPIRFFTRSGVLTAAHRGDDIELDFPQEPAEEAAAPADLVAGLGVPFGYVGRNRFDFPARPLDRRTGRPGWRTSGYRPATRRRCERNERGAARAEQGRMRKSPTPPALGTMTITCVFLRG
jgi:predicted PhzF superfamily epimerase YddE/YHI9